MPMQLTAKTYRDFTGGINELHVDAPDNTYLRADNLWLDNMYKLTSRSGIVPYLSDYPCATTDTSLTTPIVKLFSWPNYVDTSDARHDLLFAFRSDGKVVFFDESAEIIPVKRWTYVGAKYLPSPVNAYSKEINSSIWYERDGTHLTSYSPKSSAVVINNELLATSEGAEPIKIFFGAPYILDYYGTFTTPTESQYSMTVRTAGLPALTVTAKTYPDSIDFTNITTFLYSFTIATRYIRHGFEVLDESSRISINGSPVIEASTNVTAQYYAGFIVIDPGASFSAGTPHLYTVGNTYLKIYRTSGNGTQPYEIPGPEGLRYGSMFAATGNSNGTIVVLNKTFTSTYLAVNSDIEVMHFANGVSTDVHTYYVLGYTPSTGALTLSLSEGGAPADLSSLGTSHGFWVHGLNIRYLNADFLAEGLVIGDYTNIFYADDSIPDGIPLYTNGGVLDNDPPPIAKCAILAGNVVWYLDVNQLNTDVRLPFRMVQSVQYDFDSVPSGNYLDFPEPLVGGAYTETEILVVGTMSKIYRVTGSYDELGGGTPYYTEISSDTGIAGQNSVYVSGDKIYFQGKDGFYVTNGYQVTRLSDKFPTSFSNWVKETYNISKASYTSVAYNKADDKIHWTINTFTDDPAIASPYTYYPNSFATLDLRLVKEDLSCFTFPHYQTGLSGYPTVPNDSITCMTTHKDKVVIGTYGGLVLTLDEASYYDLKVNESYPTDSTKWSKYPISYFFNSACTNFGVDIYKKWVPKLNITCDNVADLSLSIQTEADNSSVVKTLKNIIYRNSSPNPYPEPVKSYRSLAMYTRRIPSPKLRVNYLETKFFPAELITQNSDSLSVGTVNATLKIVVLNTGYYFSPYSVGQKIYFEDDSYTAGYTITSINAGLDTIVYSDSLNATTSGTKKWQIKGTPAGEKFRLVQFSYMFSPISPTVNAFHSGDTGANE